MGNLNKKFIVKEAEGILEECEFRENLKKKQLVEINKQYKNLKREKFNTKDNNSTYVNYIINYNNMKIGNLIYKDKRDN